MAITITEILGTDSISGSRLTINANFLLLENAYNDLEQRIVELSKQEELKSMRPELDGAEIMKVLNIKPGPEVGKAYQFLLDLRLDKGIIGIDKATEELKTWWAKNS